jgi:hypothetical protein
MNRTIKFRICYTAQNGPKSLIYSDDKRYLITLDGKVLENYGKDWKKPFWEEVFDADEQPIIQQYTGCHDSDNKEIYEGDIVQYNNGDVIRIGYIEFMSGIFFLNYNDETDEELGYLLVSNLKVIGNKFEHKELLN